MSEQLFIPTGTKDQVYTTILPQIKALIEGESNLIANLANISSVLHTTFKHLWVGFYLVEGDELVLGPFQGPIACTRIKKGKGVCGESWEKKKTMVIPNVLVHPNHIACSSESVSEIVVPVFDKNGNVFGVLDIDSKKEGEFDEIDQKFLEQLATLITPFTA